MRDIRVLVFWKGNNTASDNVVMHASEAWMQLGSQYSNLEDIYMIDVDTASNEDLIKALNIRTVPTIVFMQKYNRGWISINRVVGPATRAQINAAYMKALSYPDAEPQEGDQGTESPDGLIYVADTDGSGMGFGIADFAKRFWWIWLILAATLITNRR